jgi:hypothetical protein
MNFWDLCHAHPWGAFVLALVAVLWVPFCLSAGPSDRSERRKP